MADLTEKIVSNILLSKPVLILAFILFIFLMGGMDFIMKNPIIMVLGIITLAVITINKK